MQEIEDEKDRIKVINNREKKATANRKLKALELQLKKTIDDQLGTVLK